jgi:hypothetical protein
MEIPAALLEETIIKEQQVASSSPSLAADISLPKALVSQVPWATPAPSCWLANPMCSLLLSARLCVVAHRETVISIFRHTIIRSDL